MREASRAVQCVAHHDPPHTHTHPHPPTHTPNIPKQTLGHTLSAPAAPAHAHSLAVPSSRNSKSWLDRVLTASMGTFNEFAAYSEQGAAGSPAGVGGAAGPDTDSPWPAEARGPAAPDRQPEAEAGPPLLRDIVTGEVLPAGDDEGPAGAPSSAGSWEGSTPPRDLRLEPVNQVASWLGAGGSSSARQQQQVQPRRRGSRSSSGASDGGGKGGSGPSAAA